MYKEKLLTILNMSRLKTNLWLLKTNCGSWDEVFRCSWSVVVEGGL